MTEGHACSRFGLDMTASAAQAALRYLRRELFQAIPLYEGPTMAAFGEENRDWGGAFGV